MNGEYISKSLSEMLDELKRNRYKNLKNTIEFGFEVYSLCAKENYKAGMAYALNCIAKAYIDLNKYEKAIGYLFDSIKLAQKQNICDLQISGYVNIGNIYFDIGEYEKSLEYYNSAKKLAPIVDHSKNYHKSSSYELYAGMIYNNIGEIYRVVKCYEEALENYNLALELYRKANLEDTFDIGITLTNIGNIHYQFGDYDKALEYLNEAYGNLINHENKIGIVETCGLIALVYEKKGDYEQCEKYFLKALAIASEINYAYIKIQILLDYSNFLENTGKNHIAIKKLEEVYKISVDNKLYSQTMKICKRAIRIYEKAKDIDNANKYYKLYFENEKKLEPIEAENRVKSLKTKINFDILENENKSILEQSEVFRRKAEELIEIIKNISIISELGEKITTTLNLEKIYHMIYATIQSFMKASGFAIGLYNDTERKIKYPYCIENNTRGEMRDTSFDNLSSMGVKCLRENKIIVINDMVNEYLNYIQDVNYIIDNKACAEHNSAIFCPLMIDKSIIGVMTVQAHEKDTFTMLKVEMIRALSSYAAIAINNAIKSESLLVEVEERRKIQAQLEETNNKLKYLSENDALTNIPNRRKFDLVITEEWSKAKEKRNPISLMIFDIDYFKQYNDNFGHTEGDKCIINISKELRKALVKNYFAARYGGDEFIVLLPDTDLEEAINFGENLRRNVKKLSLPHKFSPISEVVTITLGVSSVIPDNHIEIIDLIRQADNALYEAKENGRNQIVGLKL